MDKKTLHEKWYFRVLQVIFWATFIFLIPLSIVSVLYEDDIPLAGFFWMAALVIVYWIIKKILYYALVKDKNRPRKNKGR